MALQALLHVLQQALLIGAPVLLAHAHLAVLHLDAGPQGQHIGAQSRHAGAAAALTEIAQLLHHEADVQQLTPLVHPLLDLLGGQLALLGQLRRLQHQQSDAGGEIAGVHGVDIAHLRRRDAGVLIAGGHLAGDVEVHHRVGALQLLAEELHIVVHRHRRRGAHAAALLYMGVDLVGGDVHAIHQGFAVPDDVQGRDADVIVRDQLGGQVAGAVCGNFYIHMYLFLLNQCPEAGGISLWYHNAAHTASFFTDTGRSAGGAGSASPAISPGSPGPGGGSPAPRRATGGRPRPWRRGADPGRPGHG